MSAPARKGGASRPSPLRRLFASLRQRPKSVSPPAPPPLSSGGTAPAPRLLPDATGRPRQASLLEPTDGGYQARIVAMQDFIARLKRQMARLNIGRNDPLAPLLEFLGEMLLHLTHLLDDLSRELTGHAERSLAQLNIATERTRGLFAEDVRAVQRELSQLATRIEGIVGEIGRDRRNTHESFGKEARDLLVRTVIHYSRQKIWNGRAIAAALALGAGAGLYALGLDNGSAWTRASMKETEADYTMALMQGGKANALKWIELVGWNPDGPTLQDCAPQQSGNASRLACTYTLWAGPPDEMPPQAAVATASEVMSTPPSVPASPPIWAFPGPPPTGPVEFHH